MTELTDSSMVREVVDAFFEDEAHLWVDPQEPVEIGSGITLITGPSGCGKSTTLRRLIEDGSGWTVLPQIDQNIPLIDQFRGDLGERLSWLSRFGLGDAQVVVRPGSALSDGQAFRARLALALGSGAQQIAVDEFLSTVDRVTASVVARNTARLCRNSGVDLVVATAHGDLDDALDPDQVIRVRANDRPSVELRTAPRRWGVGERIQVGHGSLADFEALQRFHYYTALDFAPDRREVSVVAATLDAEPIAARLYCAPYPRAWADKLPQFREVNDAMVLGHRLVVHPSFRGVGLARRVAAGEFAPKAVVYTRSIMSRFTDFHATLGYERHTPLGNSLKEKATGDVRADALRGVMTEFADYRTVLGATDGLAHDLAAVRDWFAPKLRAFSTEQLIASASVEDMGGYVLRRQTEKRVPS